MELDLPERIADLMPERLDKVIRIGRLPNSTLIAAKLAEQRRPLVASPAYLERTGSPAVHTDLARHRLIAKRHGTDLLGCGNFLGHTAKHADDAVFRSDAFEAMRLAVRAGFRVALLADRVVGPDVSEGHLTRLRIGGESWDTDPAGFCLLRALAQPSARLHVEITALSATIGGPPIWRTDWRAAFIVW